MGQENLIKQINGHMLFFISILALLFLHYPAALIYPYGSSGGDVVHDFELPILAISNTLSLCYLLCNLNRLLAEKKLFSLALAFNMISIISGYINHSTLIDTLHLTSYINTPLALIIASPFIPHKENLLSICCSTLFFINLIIVLSLNNIVGLHGNQNWLSAIAVPTATITIVKIRFSQKWLNFILRIITLIGLSFILWKTQTRTLIPASAIVIICYLTSRYKKKSIPYILLLIIGLTGLGFATQDKINQIALADIRLPLTISSIEMTLDKPFLGHGPGQFIPAFPEYASDALKQRLHSAPIFEHPHNELIHLSSQVGLIGLTLFLVFLLYILKYNSKLKLYTGLTIFLLVLGLADKSLNQGAAALLFFICLAICYKVKPHHNISKFTLPYHRFITASLSIVLVYFAVPKIYDFASSRYTFWQGEKTLHSNPPQALNNFIKASKFDPHNLHCNYHTARLLIHHNRLVEAITFLDQVSLLAPNYAKVHEVRGTLLAKLSDKQTDKKNKAHLHKLSLESFQRSIDQHPQDLRRYPAFINALNLPKEQALQKNLIMRFKSEFFKKLVFRDSFSSSPSKDLIHQMNLALEQNNQTLFTTAANQLFHELKFPKMIFTHWLASFTPDLAPYTISLSKLAFNKQDFLFFRDLKSFLNENKHLSLTQFLREISINSSNQEVLLPKQSLNSLKNLSPQSASALISLFLRSKRLKPTIHMSLTKESHLIWREANQLWQLQLKPSKQLQLIKNTPESARRQYFFYPQELMPKNFLLLQLLGFDFKTIIETDTKTVKKPFFELKKK